MSEMKQNQKDASRKEDLGIERAILDEATYSEFLLNTARYVFSAQYVKSQTGGGGIRYGMWHRLWNTIFFKG